ncbi:MAG: cytochrome c oxidase subunit 3 [Ilumatobacteraceae bacterium]
MSSMAISPPRVAPKNQVLLGTAFAASAVFMLMFGMLSIWLRFRDASPLRKSSDGVKMIHDWLPADIEIPGVATNTILITLVMACVIAQWGVYAARRADAAHAYLALGIVVVLGIAAINAQVAVYVQMGIGIGDGAYQTMFYAITGTMTALLISGVAFSLVALFRALGGRLRDHQVVSAHALYWYAITAAFVSMWFVVYVQK